MFSVNMYNYILGTVMEAKWAPYNKWSIIYWEEGEIFFIVELPEYFCLEEINIREIFKPYTDSYYNYYV